ncbi:MAG: GMC oxidoreductase [Saprospiraceae bacterium]|nr:GMC oxidoreductase [Saprospiraceae bacterium]
MKELNTSYDYVIIGSGFGGSVSALRLAEKGYSILVIEKGKWFSAEDFPKSNWHIRKWLWAPALRCFGFFKMTYLNHVTILSGVGVGGGSLTYANTLPIPKSTFFKTGSWAKLSNWEEELKPHYSTAFRMLGASKNKGFGPADKLVEELAQDMDRPEHFDAPHVAVYFGESGKTVEDPYFDGKGPTRTGCIQCGACMTGCKHNAKNTLDKNYLYLAQQLGAQIIAEHEVYDIIPKDKKRGSTGYTIHFRNSYGRKKSKMIRANHVIFSGGVLGTVPLLLQLKAKKSLPHLSDMVGRNIRTNNESLLGITSTSKKAKDFTQGVAIGSIFNLDKHSHLEPVRYGKGSGFFRLLSIPHVHHKWAIVRLLGVLGVIITKPVTFFKTLFKSKFSESTVILLFMQNLESTLRLQLGRITPLKTSVESGPTPSGYIPEAANLAQAVGNKIEGIPYANFTDVVLGTPTTAHILGGAVMGESIESGVIDKQNNVFGYENMMICDGSMISSNPGVNPSLTITAISELAMSKIKPKLSNSSSNSKQIQEHV